MTSQRSLDLLPAQEPRPERILLVRTDRLGDVVLILPMLPLLRKRFPNARIALLVRTYTADLLDGNPFVDEVILYDDGNRQVPFADMLKTIRAGRYDTTIVIHPTFRLAWLMFRAGIPLRVGTGYRWYSFLLNKRVYEHRKDARRHELEYNLNLLKELNCPVDGVPVFHLGIFPEVEAAIDQLLESLAIEKTGEIIILHPGSGGSAREWPAQYFGSLAARLIDERGAHVIVTGRKGEERKVAEVLIGSKGRAVPLVGKLSLKQLVALIRRSHLFVSNSTGPMHIAAATGVPVVSFFPQMPAMSARRWGPCIDMKAVFTPDKPQDCKECVVGKDLPCACMMSIPVDVVYDAARVLLEKRKHNTVVSHD